VISILEARLSEHSVVEIFEDPRNRGDDWKEISEEELEPAAKNLRMNLRADLAAVISSWKPDQILLMRVICLLDPRFKSMIFLDKSVRKEIQLELKRMCVSFAIKMIRLEEEKISASAGSPPVTEEKSEEKVESARNSARHRRGSLDQYMRSIHRATTKMVTMTKCCV
jgi:hypothetical protein